MDDQLIGEVRWHLPRGLSGKGTDTMPKLRRTLGWIALGSLVSCARIVTPNARPAMTSSARAAVPTAMRSSMSKPADIEQRVDAILKKMSLEEKIDYLGGVDEFYIRANERLGLPALRMADGPLGIRKYGP